MSSLNDLGPDISRSMQTSTAKTSEKSSELNFDQTLECLALFIAQTWIDEHPNTCLDRKAENDCIIYVTHEMVKAGTAVGGPIGLELLTGGASKSAYAACRRLFPPSPQRKRTL